MWWLIGILVGTAWNIHDEKKNPELRARREREARSTPLQWAGALLAIGVTVLIVASMYYNRLISIFPSLAARPASTVTATTAEVPKTPVAAVTIPAEPVESPADTSVLSPSTQSNLAKPAPSYYGTSDTNFGKSWVVVEGTKIEGITRADPAPEGQVALLYSDGGKNVSASSLPQGFLDFWNLTPDRFEAVQGQQ